MKTKLTLGKSVSMELRDLLYYEPYDSLHGLLDKSIDEFLSESINTTLNDLTYDSLYWSIQFSIKNTI
jgi:hypothetical protein